MDRTRNKTINSVRQFSPLLTLAELGCSPEEIKQGIIEILAPHFRNQDVLNDFATGVLAPEAVNVLKLKDDPLAYQAFVDALGTYRSAANIDKEACLRCCAELERDIENGISEFWSMFHLEQDKSDLPLEDFRYETFRTIGSLIEASLQPLLKSLLLQVRIAGGKNILPSTIRSQSLGSVVGELHDTNTLPDLVAPPPWQIRLNQWRNIAQHHRSRTKNGKIVGYYRLGSTEHTIVLSKGELLAVLQRISFILAAIRAAYTIFATDNFDELGSHLSEVEVREDVKIFALATALTTQGYELTHLKIEDTSVLAVIRDVTNGPNLTRMAHSAQFVYPIWRYLPTNVVKVVYQDNAGLPRLMITANGTDCRAVSKEEISFHALAEKVNLERLQN